MNKKDMIMLEMLSNSINYYGEAQRQAQSLHEFAVHNRNDKLAAATEKAVNGLSELIQHFSLQQSAILKRNNAINIPIKSEETDEYEINFEGIHFDGNPLW